MDECHLVIKTLLQPGLGSLNTGGILQHFDATKITSINAKLMDDPVLHGAVPEHDNNIGDRQCVSYKVVKTLRE